MRLYNKDAFINSVGNTPIGREASRYIYEVLCRSLEIYLDIFLSYTFLKKNLFIYIVIVIMY